MGGAVTITATNSSARLNAGTSIVLGNISAANVYAEAEFGDLSLVTIVASNETTLIATGKLLSLADSSVTTNVTTSTFNVSSGGFYLNHEEVGFGAAISEFDNNLIKVSADKYVSQGIDGQTKRVTTNTADSYIVNQASDKQDIYAQFIAQNSNADVSGLIDDTLTEQQIEQALNRFISTSSFVSPNKIVSTPTITGKSDSLLERVRQDNSGRLDESFDLLSRDLGVQEGSLLTPRVSGQDELSNGRTQTVFERQLQDSILRSNAFGLEPQVGDSLYFTNRTMAASGISSLSPVQSLVSDLVNATGNRQVDVLGNMTSEYLFFYSIEDEEEALLNSIL